MVLLLNAGCRVALSHHIFALCLIERFPETSLSTVLSNVFAVDLANPTVVSVLQDVMRRHAIPMDVERGAGVERTQLRALAPSNAVVRWQLLPSSLTALQRVVDCASTTHRPWRWRRDYDTDLRGRTEARISRFSELCFAFSLPAKTVAADCVGTADGRLHVLLSSPIQVLSYDRDLLRVDIFDLSMHL